MRILLGVLFYIVIVGSYAADWKFASSDSQKNIYQDASSIEAFEGGVLIWERYEFINTVAVQGVPVKQILTRTVYDCKNNRHGTRRMIVYGPDANEISDNTEENIEFKPLGANDVTRLTLMINACSFAK